MEKDQPAGPVVLLTAREVAARLHLGAQALAAAQGGHLPPARAHQHALRALARGGR